MSMRPGDSEPVDDGSHVRPGRFRRSRWALPVTAAAAYLAATAGGAPERSVSSGHDAPPDVPARVADRDFEFFGDRPEDVERFYRSYLVADDYWRSLGVEADSCETELKVIFTRRFAGYRQANLPYGAINCERGPDTPEAPGGRLWINRDIVADPDRLDQLIAHEIGHARGFRHSADPDSIMYGNLERTYGEPPPAAATVARLEAIRRHPAS